MVVGGFHHVVVVPCTGRVVGPGHNAVYDAVGVYAAVEHTVDYSHCLGACDRLAGTEGSVGITVYPAVGHGGGNILVCPVAGGDVGEGHCAVLGIHEAGGDGNKLGAGDIPAAAEAAVGIAQNVAAVGHGGYSLVEPLGGLHIGEGVGGGEHRVAFFSSQQAVKRRGDLCAGDVAIGLNRTVGIAHDVFEVVDAVQVGGQIGLRNFGIRDILSRSWRDDDYGRGHGVVYCGNCEVFTVRLCSNGIAGAEVIECCRAVCGNIVSPSRGRLVHQLKRVGELYAVCVFHRNVYSPHKTLVLAGSVSDRIRELTC